MDSEFVLVCIKLSRKPRFREKTPFRRYGYGLKIVRKDGIVISYGFVTVVGRDSGIAFKIQIIGGRVNAESVE